MKEPARWYFDDGEGRACWIQKLGSLDSDTIYWMGGPGYEMRLFSAQHSSESEFTRDELVRELESRDEAIAAWS